MSSSSTPTKEENCETSVLLIPPVAGVDGEVDEIVEQRENENERRKKTVIPPMMPLCLGGDDDGDSTIDGENGGTNQLSSIGRNHTSSSGSPRVGDHPCLRVYGECKLDADAKQICKFAFFPEDTCLRWIKNRCGRAHDCPERHVTLEEKEKYLAMADDANAALGFIPSPKKRQAPVSSAPLPPDGLGDSPPLVPAAAAGGGSWSDIAARSKKTVVVSPSGGSGGGGGHGLGSSAALMLALDVPEMEHISSVIPPVLAPPAPAGGGDGGDVAIPVNKMGSRKNSNRSCGSMPHQQEQEKKEILTLMEEEVEIEGEMVPQPPRRVKASDLEVGDHLFIFQEPCRVTALRSLKKQVHITAVGLFNNSSGTQIFSHAIAANFEVEVPMVVEKTFRLTDISEDGEVTIVHPRTGIRPTIDISDVDSDNEEDEGGKVGGDDIEGGEEEEGQQGEKGVKTPSLSRQVKRILAATQQQQRSGNNGDQRGEEETVATVGVLVVVLCAVSPSISRGKIVRAYEGRAALPTATEAESRAPSSLATLPCGIPLTLAPTNEAVQSVREMVGAPPAPPIAFGAENILAGVVQPISALGIDDDDMLPVGAAPAVAGPQGVIAAETAVPTPTTTITTGGGQHHGLVSAIGEEGSTPVHHPCHRVYGKCRHTQGECRFTYFPYNTCLRALKKRCSGKLGRMKCQEYHCTDEEAARYFALAEAEAASKNTEKITVTTTVDEKRGGTVKTPSFPEALVVAEPKDVSILPKALETKPPTATPLGAQSEPVLTSAEGGGGGAAVAIAAAGAEAMPLESQSRRQNQVAAHTVTALESEAGPSERRKPPGLQALLEKAAAEKPFKSGLTATAAPFIPSVHPFRSVWCDDVNQPTTLPSKAADIHSMQHQHQHADPVLVPGQGPKGPSTPHLVDPPLVPYAADDQTVPPAQVDLSETLELLEVPPAQVDLSETLELLEVSSAEHHRPTPHHWIPLTGPDDVVVLKETLIQKKVRKQREAADVRASLVASSTTVTLQEQQQVKTMAISIDGNNYAHLAPLATDDSQVGIEAAEEYGFLPRNVKRKRKTKKERNLKNAMRKEEEEEEEEEVLAANVIAVSPEAILREYQRQAAEAAITAAHSAQPLHLGWGKVTDEDDDEMLPW